jgi:hypothetical protein
MKRNMERGNSHAEFGLQLGIIFQVVNAHIAKISCTVVSDIVALCTGPEVPSTDVHTVGAIFV